MLTKHTSPQVTSYSLSNVVTEQNILTYSHAMRTIYLIPKSNSGIMCPVLVDKTKNLDLH